MVDMFTRSNIKKALTVCALLLILAVMVYPLVWMVAISLRTGDGTSLRFYREVWQAGPFDRYFFNSVIVALVVVATEFPVGRGSFFL
jgi:ABC-type spermidine/putrescine transport system permease subunit II